MLIAFENAAEIKLIGDEIFYIILSDGQDIGSRSNIDYISKRFKKGKIFAVDFSKERKGNKDLRKIVELSGGQLFKAKDVGELQQQFREIGERIIFSGYELTYNPNVAPLVTLNNIKASLNNSVINNLDIEEVKTREIFPLLNYIFFEKNISELSERYKIISTEDAQDFNIEKLVPNQMSIYNDILNILGKRLIEKEDTKISLIGCNDNTKSEKNDLELSKSRAETIKNYFTDVWQIASERITIKTRNLPVKKSNNKTSAGQEENRRVEIITDDVSILDIVETFSYSNVASPEGLSLEYSVKSKYPIDNWKLSVEQNNEQIFSETGTGSIPNKIFWNVNSSIRNKKIDNTPLTLSLLATDTKGSSSLEKQKLRLNYSSKETADNDKLLEKLSLVLFEFNSASLDKRNSDVLDYLNNSFKEKSTLTVKGYTDNIGSEQFNKKLSEKRAKATLDALIEQLNPRLKKQKTVGMGETSPLFDNNLPEGRFYNRTCRIIVETIE